MKGLNKKLLVYEPNKTCRRSQQPLPGRTVHVIQMVTGLLGQIVSVAGRHGQHMTHAHALAKEDRGNLTCLRTHSRACLVSKKSCCTPLVSWPSASSWLILAGNWLTSSTCLSSLVSWKVNCTGHANHK